MKEVELAAWARKNREYIEEELVRHGAILFRGFGVRGIEGFEEIGEAVSKGLYERYGDLPREREGGKVYGSTPYPAGEAILFHNESSHLKSWPMKILFHCVRAARRGGQTPLVDCRRLYGRLREELRKEFKARKLMYVRNFGEGLDVRWEEFYGTNSREEVQRQCRETGTEWEWKQAGGLRTRQVRDAVARHPLSGEDVFFNQVQLHHVSCLNEEVRRAVEMMYGEEDLPRNVYWGDGEAIGDELMKEVGRMYEQEAITFVWEEGDVLLLDNMLMAHGRRPFEGERKIVVAMGEMMEEGGE
jgi:alpha-ketoglutarate-dependent taurine dioxygenase